MLWIIGNASNETITVTLSEFSKKKHATDDKGTGPTPNPPPLIWLCTGSLTLADKTAGFIAAIRNPAYEAGLFHDHYSYTIGIVGETFNVAWDPDGEIKP
ncbi:MAG TPA: hypothetical protein VLT86_03225 [Vicinamibacterales bacterium]|nr:hypothetical protein [Vicinamibacterales bacterium]